MRKLFKEFKEFISRGNVLDLAVGMIIGAAFTAIINSIVNYVLKPLISLIPVGNDGTFKTVLREEVVELNASPSSSTRKKCRNSAIGRATDL